MKAIILEDNLSDSWTFEMILEEQGVQVLGVYKSWKDVLPELKKNLPDFMIVDLNLEQNERGLDFIDEMKNMFIPIIICTGYSNQVDFEEALESGVKAVISKPIDKRSLIFQIKKLIKELTNNRLKNDYLIVKDKSSLIKVPVERIFKIEIDGNYSYIFLESNKRYVIKMSLKKVLKMLDPEIFIRCHRSTIINLEHVARVETRDNQLTMSNDMIVDVGRRFKSVIRKSFMDY